LYRCIVRGIVGLCGCEKKIMPNEELPSFEALTAEYPPWLIKRVFKKLKRKGYVVERNNKLIVVDTQIVKEIKNSDERWYYILSILFGVSFLGFLITLTCLLI
jgi:DNA-binding transcriptional regulator YhcF (GntR family)